MHDTFAGQRSISTHLLQISCRSKTIAIFRDFTRLTRHLPLTTLALILIAFVSVLTSPAAVPSTKPNIVLILSDDYGWGSVGCYGATNVVTPNLDRLAQQGRRFTHAYAPGSV